MTETPLSLALFDCDGTLVDSQHAIVAAMTAAATGLGLAPLPAVKVRRVVGLPLVEAIAALWPTLTGPMHERLASLYRDAFLSARQNSDNMEPLFDGIPEALAALNQAGILLGIATGKSMRGLLAVLERHDLRFRFVTLQTADQGPGKPNPAMVLRAMAEVGGAPARTVVIGDTTFDILMARGARVASIGVGWGYHDRAELVAAGADRIVGERGELPAAVEALLGRREGVG